MATRGNCYMIIRYSPKSQPSHSLGALPNVCEVEQQQQQQHPSCGIADPVHDADSSDTEAQVAESGNTHKVCIYK